MRNNLKKIKMNYDNPQIVQLKKAQADNTVIWIILAIFFAVASIIIGRFVARIWGH